MMVIDYNVAPFLDFTAQLAPVLWGMVALLLVLAGALAASVDPEVAEIYLGDRRLLVVTFALAALTGIALVAAHPGAAFGFRP